MAEEEVLINARIEVGDSAKKIEELASKVSELKAKQKELDLTTKEGRQENEAYKLAIKGLNQEIREESKQFLNAKKTLDSQNGSLKSMRAELSNLKKAYSEMSKEQREGEEGVKQRNSIANLNQELKDLEVAYGDNQRLVGSYEEAINKALGGNSKFMQSMQGLASGNMSVASSLKVAGAGVKAFGMQLLKLLANPIVLIVSGIAAVFLLLYSVFKKMISVIKGNEEQSNRLEKVMQPLRVIGDLVTNTFEKLADVFLKIAEVMVGVISGFLKFIGVQNEANELTRQYIELEERKQALIKNTRFLNEQMARNDRDIAKQRAIVSDKEKYTLEERERANKKAIELSEQNLKLELANAKEKLSIMEREDEKTKSGKEYLDKLSEARINLINVEKNYFEQMRTLSRDRLRVTNEEEADRKEIQKQAKERADKRIEDLIKEIDIEKNISIKKLAYTKTYHQNSFALTQEYLQKEFLVNQDAEKRKLDLQLRGGKISKTYYNQMLDAMLLDRQTFERNQNKILLDEYDKQLKLLEQSEEAQIKTIKESYEKQLQEYYLLMERLGVSEEIMLQNSKSYAIGLAKLQEKEIEQIKATSISSIIKNIETKLEKHYNNDLALFSDNETEKTKLLISQTIEKIELINKENEIRAKAGKELIDVLELEVQLRIYKAKLIQLETTTELIKAQESAEKTYQIKRDALLAELELYKDNYSKKVELENALAQLEKEKHAEKMADFEEYVEIVAESLNNISSLSKALGEKEVAENEQENERKKDILKTRLDSGLISQEEYNNLIAQGDKDLAKKQNEIARKQAIFERGIKIFEIGISTAQGIMKAVASSPLTGGLPFSAIVAAMGAVQAGAVLAQPLPKASKGLLLKGKSHAMGGIPIEAEGGEAIINKRSTSMFTPLLSAINQAGGGVSLGNDGGFASRRAENLANKDMSEGLANALSKIKIFTAVEDINRGQKKYSKIVDRATY